MANDNTRTQYVIRQLNQRYAPGRFVRVRVSEPEGEVKALPKEEKDCGGATK